MVIFVTAIPKTISCGAIAFTEVPTLFSAPDCQRQSSQTSLEAAGGLGLRGEPDEPSAHRGSSSRPGCIAWRYDTASTVLPTVTQREEVPGGDAPAGAPAAGKIFQSYSRGLAGLKRFPTRFSQPGTGRVHSRLEVKDDLTRLPAAFCGLLPVRGRKTTPGGVESSRSSSKTSR
jgi:hypothetical protein